jgi:glycosyltransferase involved in cell wall biosynthesis
VASILAMRIGIIAPPWVAVPPPAYGGTEGVIDRLARGYVAAGHDVLLWTTGDSTCPVRRDSALERSAPERLGDCATEVHHVVRGYAAIRRWGADIVHDHTWAGPAHGVPSGTLRIVATNHGPFTGDVLGIYQELSPDLPIIAISHDQASHARGVAIADVIHHGVELAGFPAGAGTGDADGSYVLFLGRMGPEKGAREAAIAAKRAGTRLLIAAKRREAAELEFFEKHVEPLLDDDIVYLGEVRHDEKLRLLRGARALINPIQWDEPFGLVMIEALASGTPVLAFSRGAAPEIVTDGVTGYLCSDIDELVGRIGAIGAIDRRACRSSVADRFTSERMVSAHLALFDRLRMS